ncbi:molybdenum cofactor biosynthesis protein MoaE [Sphingomonas sp. 1P06PA]|uniref:molybdenum cofactor biosynthesis protein MoaE n=1 Tax=Sphingomonas sp. 1P06PA TaxID=554121 RepID=UPI0039A54F9E
MIRVAVTAADIDSGAELAKLEALGGGGVASFTGIVRGGDGLEALLLEHHPRLTEPVMRDIAGEASRRWNLLGVVLVHRFGRLHPGERIIFCAAAARHRQAALDATGFLVDWAKTKAPFWKQEQFADGRRHWIEARAADDVAADRWTDHAGR